MEILVYVQWGVFFTLLIALHIVSRWRDSLIKWTGIGFRIWSVYAALVSTMIMAIVASRIRSGALDLQQGWPYLAYVTVVYLMCVAFFSYGKFLMVSFK